MVEDRARSLLRQLLAATGLDRSEAEIEALLPGFRVRRDAAAALASLDFGDAPLSIGGTAAWRDWPVSEPPSPDKEDRR